MSARRMRVEQQLSSPCSWMTSWAEGRCSTGRCRTLNLTPFWGTSRQASSTRWASLSSRNEENENLEKNWFLCIKTTNWSEIQFDTVNVANDHHSWKQLLFYGSSMNCTLKYSTVCTHYWQTLVLRSSSTLYLLMRVYQKTHLAKLNLFVLISWIIRFLLLLWEIKDMREIAKKLTAEYTAVHYSH